jgi:hypothetical protein
MAADPLAHYTVPQLRDLERRTWQQVERKKEELRQLVGDRYRDLLASADSILLMRDLAARALEVWESMLRAQEGILQRTGAGAGAAAAAVAIASPSPPPPPPPPPPAPPQSALLELVALPETVWRRLSERQSLQAAQAFHEAQATLARLRAAQPADASLVALLAELEAVLRAVPRVLASGCQHQLLLPDLGAEAYAHALAVCGSLDAALSDADLLELLLRSRLAWLRAALRAAQRAGAGATGPACAFVARAVRATLMHAALLFGPEGRDAAALARAHAKWFDAAAPAAADRALSVAALRERFAAPPRRGERVAPEALRRASEAWLAEAAGVVHQETPALLQRLERGREVGAVMHAVLEELSGDEDDAQRVAAHREVVWAECCRVALGRQLPLWQCLFAAPFTARCEAIARASFAAIQLTDVLQRAYAAVEAGGASGGGGPWVRRWWTPVRDLEERGAADVSATLEGRGDAGARAEALNVAELEAAVCLHFQRRLAAALQDARHLLQLASGAQPGPEWRAVRLMVHGALMPVVRLLSTEALSKAVVFLQQRLGALQTRALDALEADALASCADQALFTARICQRLLQDASVLQDVVGIESAVAAPDAGDARSTADYVRSALSELREASRRTWSRLVASKVGDAFRTELRAWLRRALDEPAGEAPAPAPAPTPTHASPHVFAALFELARELFRVNSCEMEPPVVRALLADVAQEVAAVARELLGLPDAAADAAADSAWRRLRPEAAAAALFDLQFLLLVLSGRLGEHPLLRELSAAGGWDSALPALRRGAVRLLSSVHVMLGAVTAVHQRELRRLMADESGGAGAGAGAGAGDAAGEAVALAPVAPLLQALPTVLYPARP